MKTFLKWLLRAGIVLLLVALVLGIWQRERLVRLMAVNSLFSTKKIVGNFSAMDTLFVTVEMPRGDGPVSPLPAGAPYALPAEVQDWIVARNVTGLVILQDGQLRHESYYLGGDADDQRISWSVAKSFLSALIGILIDEGAIDSIDDPVTKYAPELAGSAYDGATLRNVLNMSSGVVFDEDYLDFWSDINKMGRILGLGGSMDGFAAGLDQRFTDAGDQWQYVSIDTHIVGMVARGATGRSVPDLLNDKVLRPLGLEGSPYYLTDGYGVAFVLGGLNMSTRDYARFGAMIVQGGEWNGNQIVPADWIANSIAPSAPTAAGDIGYGFQWWIPQGSDAGVTMARGIYGQYIYIDTARGVVIAVNAADRAFREAGVADRNIAIFRQIAQGL
ncbi:serine hydrolase domain-containing protein [Octadecabacter sp. R77987]|uniref:serine hydrolase domain-containing protein n=1 Tax=Octadecabacter sp. R77987 TaxID=3093874 RepID=UPI0036729C54